MTCIVEIKDSVGKAVRAVFSGETEEEAERRKSGSGVREQRLAELGFTEHQWRTGPFAYAICDSCRAWLSTHDDDLAAHKAFHDRLGSE